MEQRMSGEQAEQAAEKVGRFVGRGFSHDASALDSSGVLTPEARKCHFSVACSARLVLKLPTKFKFKQAEARSTGSRLLACPSDRRRYPCTAGVSAKRS
jgi:hypothetical protein